MDEGCAACRADPVARLRQDVTSEENAAAVPPAPVTLKTF